MSGFRRTALAGVALCGLLGPGCLEELLPDDGYEPNDSFETAADITGEGPVSAYVNCADYEDYFCIVVPAGSQLNVGCIYPSEAGEITMELYVNPADPAKLAESAPVAPGEATMSYDAGGSGVPAGTYYIVVYYWGSSVSGYGLTWALLP